MKSIRELYKIGKGPSSSHTMGPEKASVLFKSKHPNADGFIVTLYGSLSRTGVGHGTDRVIVETLRPIPTEIRFNNDDTLALPHPNTMEFVALREGKQVDFMRVMSIGGGEIRIEGNDELTTPDIYPERTFSEIAEFCKNRNIRISDYVELREGPEIWDFLFHIWNTMCNAIQDGLTRRGILPGGLNVERKAQFLYNQRHIDERPETRESRIVCAYAFALSEQNADLGTVVTAPTCGACSTLPAVLKYMQEHKNLSDQHILRALAVAGIVGNLVKTNASISGAECGCQAEIGTACSMAAAALGELLEMGIDQIEYAAEVALEHHLGLTCDPICGLVQIPCIERNAVAAMRAINAVRIANFLTSTRKISFDMVVETMYQTGRDLNRIYRETSEGGLAKLYK
ncbi:MAG: L-serine ammonia-lyase, iron-sulfur-dependent, subunit alpha [Christensenellales bacterium]|nr:L-serine ammonia-lyase, iron-sulfur-dependent, subunit alpha [Christensenellales bacterium]